MAIVVKTSKGLIEVKGKVTRVKGVTIGGCRAAA
jgi:hypothetical protein